MTIANQIIRPTLLVDETRARANIMEMTRRARSSGVTFRPHFKTHQSIEVGRWYRDAGVEAITVSSASMAEYFATDGWKDILIASPINVRELARLEQLAESVRLHVTVDSSSAVCHLAKGRFAKLTVWIEIDSGDHRTGIDTSDRPALERVARQVMEANGLELAGLIAHDGHTYGVETPSDVAPVYEKTVRCLADLRSWIEPIVGQKLRLSVGDTPSGKLVEDHSGVDEIRPGNFVFGDLCQLSIGSCREDEIAVLLAAPVVSKSGIRREIVLHGGAVHLSKDWLLAPNGRAIFGRIAPLTDTGWGPSLPDCYVSRVSQELSVIQASDALFESVEIGDLVGVLPIHSCLTVNAMRSMRTLDGRTISCMLGEHA